MSEITDRILSVDPAKPRPSTARTGVASRIRQLKERFPEMSQRAIAKRVGCNKNNVHTVLAAYLGKNSREQLQSFQDNKADIYDSLQHRLLSSLTAAKIAKAKPMELITGAAILEDKARLVRGLATGINVSVLMDVVSAMRERKAGQQAEMQARIRERMDAK